MDENLPKPKYDPQLAERRKKLFSRFPQTTDADLRAIGAESNNDVVFSLRPSVLQGKPTDPAEMDDTQK